MSEPPELERHREPAGLVRALARILAASVPVLGVLYLSGLHFYLGVAVFEAQYLALALGALLALTFWTVPGPRRGPRSSVPWFDGVLGVLGLLCGLYAAVNWKAVLLEGVQAAVGRHALVGWICVALILEAARRVAGPALSVVALAFLLYARFTYLFPSFFYGKGTSLVQLGAYLFFDNGGIFGLPLSVGVTTVLAFVLFGEVLVATGAAQALTEFANAAVGRFRGGPAKMALVSSALFGTMSGSAVANVMVDGALTVPLMKAAGYPAPVAAAIEAVASTGGQLMPPVMGAAAFLMADFLQVPYQQIVIAGIVPALLYYASLFAYIDLLAAKMGMRGVGQRRVDWKALAAGLERLMLPLGLLVVWLFGARAEPEMAALVSAGCAVAWGLVRGWMRAPDLGRLLVKTGRSMLEIGLTTAVAGIVVGVSYITGLGSAVSLMLSSVGGQNLFVLLLLLAVACVILGMGMPTGVVYILVAVAFAPALVQLGVPPLAAHMFVFYLAMMSMVTPPVALAAYAAAAVAGADALKTGYTAVKVGAIAYIVPFLFIYDPALLMQGRPVEILMSFAAALAGAVLLGAGVAGYLAGPMGPLQRVLTLVASASLLVPVRVLKHGPQLAALGIGLAVAIAIVNRRQAGARPVTQAVENRL